MVGVKLSDEAVRVVGCFGVEASIELLIWSYGIALWGSAKPANTRTIQSFQAICLRMTVNAPWYVTNVSLHNELKIATIKQTAAKFYTRLHSKLNHYVCCFELKRIGTLIV